MDIKKIDSITFPVKDYAKSAKWYAETLGLEEIWLFQEPGPARLVIQVERVEDARHELEKKGVRFEGPTETVPGIGRFAGFKDPDGNRLWLLDYTIEHGESSG